MLRRASKRQNITKEDGPSRTVVNSVKHEKRKRVLGTGEDKADSELLLEGLVLGGEADVTERLFESSTKEKDTTASSLASKTPAWVDQDDESIIVKITKDREFEGIRHRDEKSLSGAVYNERLKASFHRVKSAPTWAKLESIKRKTSDDEESDVEDLLQKTGNFLASSSSLPRGTLQIKQCPHANMEAPTIGKARNVEFHPSAQVILTAAMDQNLHLFQVDGKTNPKIQTVFMDKFPIMCAHFSTNGEEVILGSRHKSFYFYDMIAGKVITVPKIKGLEGISMSRFEVSPDGRYLAFMGTYGYIHLLSARSKEWIHSLKMNGSVDSISFTRDGSKMFSHGDDGQVYIWDLNTRDCVHKFVDDGCVKGTTVSVSPSGQYLACGSSTGVVNVYDTETCFTSQYPKPLRAIMNLRTPCTKTVFNSTSEILAMCSNYTEKAIKLVHLPSLSVFSNFPEFSDNKIRIPISLDFSTHSGYMAVGNHKGNALLYRLKHYGNY